MDTAQVPSFNELGAYHMPRTYDGNEQDTASQALTEFALSY